MALAQWQQTVDWTSKKRILFSDFNRVENNLQHLKETPTDRFSLMGTIGDDPDGPREIIELHQQQSIHINYLVKRIPPGGKLYLREASRYFTNGNLAMQLDGFEDPNSPVVVDWYPCPEIGKGSFNKIDPDILKTSYWANRTRWSSPVDTGEPQNIAMWNYENLGYGHLMLENSSVTSHALVQFIILFRNLTSEQTILITDGDCGYFDFVLTTYSNSD